MSYGDDEFGDLPRPGQVPGPKGELPWLDKQFRNSSMLILILFPLCCGWIAIIFGIVGVAACKDPKARRNAIIVLSISLAWIAIVVAGTLVSRMAAPHQPGGLVR